MKIKPQNTIKGLIKEFRRIRWINADVLWPMTFVTIGFIIAFAIFFIIADGFINWVLKVFEIIN